jgi:CBS domain-containing protein
MGPSLRGWDDFRGRRTAVKIEQLMARDVKTCRPDDTLDTAARILWESDCGCLPVTTGDGSARLVGMLSDRDICMAAHFQRKPLEQIRVAEAMAREVRACNPGDTLAEAEEIMREAQVRRLPVVRDGERLLGLLSLADLAEEAARERRARKRQITQAEVGETLAAICRPRAKPASAATG